MIMLSYVSWSNLFSPPREHQVDIPLGAVFSFLHSISSRDMSCISFVIFFPPLLWWRYSHLPGVLLLKAKYLNPWGFLTIGEIRVLKLIDTIYECFPFSNLKLCFFLKCRYDFTELWLPVKVWQNMNLGDLLIILQ